MNTKIAIIISLIIQLSASGVCLAGKTSFSGSASCYIPYQLEYGEEERDKTNDDAQIKPIVTGANGEYEIQKEVRKDDQTDTSFWDKDHMTTLEETASYSARSTSYETKQNSETIVYTIYAR